MKRIGLLILITLIGFNLKSYSQNDSIQAALKNADGFVEYLNSKIKYPDICRENGIYGDVEVKFKINYKGCIDSIEVVRSPHIALSYAVTSVLKKTKCKWIPAKLNGVPVSAGLEFTTYFKLDD
jgi:TonB family protein